MQWVHISRPHKIGDTQCVLIYDSSVPFRIYLQQANPVRPEPVEGLNGLKIICHFEQREKSVFIFPDITEFTLRKSIVYASKNIFGLRWNKNVLA
jgi:hypothetical protein